jgi:hypothetical protein
MAHVLALEEYQHTDLTKSSAYDTLNLNDGTSYKLYSFIPQASAVDETTGEYPDVWDSISVQRLGTVDNRENAIATLNLWARKCTLYGIAGGVGHEIWLKYQHNNATNAVYVRVKKITCQPGISVATGSNLEIRVLREGLWWGTYAAAYASNVWTARTNGTIAICNHHDLLTHVYDYDDNGAGAPYTGGLFSTINPTYLLDNAANTGASKITEIGDGVYFGASDNTFFGMSLKITTGAVYNATFKWEYWDAANWTEFAMLTDASIKLTVTGEHYLTWGALAGWATCAVNSVTAYWIRLRCSAFVGSTSSAVTTGTTTTTTKELGLNFNYGCSHANYVKVLGADVDGDAPALCQIMIRSTVAAAAVTRVGKRSIGYPLNNTAMQGTHTNETALTTAWSGWYDNFAAPGAAYADGTAVVPLLADNYGLWRVLGRYWFATAATTGFIRTRVKTATSNAVLYTGPDTVGTAHSQWVILDLGTVTIQPTRGSPPTNFVIYDQYKRSTGSDAIREDGLYLMPCDEFYHVATATYNDTSYKLVLSGLDGRVFVGSAAYNATIYEELEPMGQPLTLEPNRDNYLFFLCDRTADANVPTDTYDVNVYIVPRYITMRGTT